MDPLSIAASTAGLLSLVIKLISLIDDTYDTVKRRSSLLREIAQDLRTLTDVLSELRDYSTHHTAGDERALRAVLEGCHTTLTQIDTELKAVKALFQRNVMVKMYAQVTFSSKMETIMQLRTQLDKYKSTLIIALNLRNIKLSSSTSLDSKIDQLRADVAKLATNDRQKAGWVHPIQQYLTTNVETGSKSSLASSEISSTNASDLTLVDDSSSLHSHGISPVPSTTGVESIRSYESFEDWLVAFRPPDNVKDSQVQEASPDNLEAKSDAGTSFPEPAVNKELIFEQHQISIMVEQLSDQIRTGEKFQPVTINLDMSDTVLELFKSIRSQGFHDIASLECNGTMCDPFNFPSNTASVTVTDGESCYSIAQGLRISLDMPLEVFYDNMVRADDHGVLAGSSCMAMKLEASQIIVRDAWAKGETSIGISLDRTLRLPEDGKIYDLPALFSPFPLLNVDSFGNRIPLPILNKGGLLVPLFHREALALTFHGRESSIEPEFAVKVLSGTVNTVSGLEGFSMDSSESQDYVVAPNQKRLDGFLTETGLIKQFVAMNLGAGYTAEAQVTGAEVFGGIQLIVAPKFLERGKFNNHEHQNRTPKDLGLRAGDHILLSGDAIHRQSQRYLVDKDWNQFREAFTHPHGSRTRPLFIHELLRAAQLDSSSFTTVTICPVPAVKVRVVVPDRQSYLKIKPRRPAKQLTPIAPSKEVLLEEKFSPHTLLSEINERVGKLCSPHVYVLFYDGQEITTELTRPLKDVLQNDGVFSCQLYKVEVDLGGYYGVRDPVRSTQNRKGPSWYQSGWDLGLGLGAPLRQTIIKHDDPMAWNWKRARIINIHLLNSLMLESLTGMTPPPCPISFKDYINAGLPFYHVVPLASIDGGRFLPNLKSVGQIDQEASIQPGNQIGDLFKPSVCVICTANLTDAILEPCHHAFCYSCIQESRDDSKLVRCSACHVMVTTIIRMSAPMETPLASITHTKSLILDRIKVDGDLAQTSQTSAKPLVQSEKTTDRPEIPLPRELPKKVSEKRVSESLSHPPSPKVVRKSEVDVQQAIQNFLNPSTSLRRGSSSGSEIFTTYEDILDAVRESDDAALRRILSVEPNAVNKLTNLQKNLLLCEVAIASENRIFDMLMELPFELQPLIDDGGMSAIHYAAERDNVTIFEKLLCLGFDMKEYTEEWRGCQATHLAAEHGNCNILYALYDAGADMDTLDGGQQQPIHVAASHGQNAALVLLLALGVDVDSRMPDGRTALNCAAHHGHTKAFRILLAKGASIGQSTMETGDSQEAKVTIGTDDSKTQASHEEKLKAWKSTLLNDTIAGGSVEIFDHLIAAGFDPHLSSSSSEETALMEAANVGSVHMTKKLLDLGADVNADRRGMTALHNAILNGNTEVVALLLQKGADVTFESRSDLTPLHAALFQGADGIVKLLLDNGADVCISKIKGNPFRQPHRKGGLECLDLMLAYGYELPEDDLTGIAVMLDACTPERFLYLLGIIEDYNVILPRDTLDCFIRALMEGSWDLQNAQDALSQLKMLPGGECLRKAYSPLGVRRTLEQILESSRHGPIADFIIENCIPPSQRREIFHDFDFLSVMVTAAERRSVETFKRVKFLVEQFGITIVLEEGDDWNGQLTDQYKKAVAELAESNDFDFVKDLLDVLPRMIAKKVVQEFVNGLSDGHERMIRWLRMRYY